MPAGSMSDATALPVDLPATDHDLLVRLWERSDSHTKRLAELVEWKHEQLPPIIIDLQKSVLLLNKDTGTLRGELSTLCATVDKLAAMVAAIFPIVQRQEKHETECTEIAKDNIRHREGFEERVNVRFDKGENARSELAKKVDGIRTWVVSGVISTLLALLGATVTIIWAVIQHGGLSLFSHP